MDTTSVAPPSTRFERGITLHRERGTCSGCSTTTKTLTAPRPNVGHGYRGPMYCLPCNPRFFTLDAHFSSLERITTV
jgi:hypothetical protein